MPLLLLQDSVDSLSLVEPTSMPSTLLGHFTGGRLMSKDICMKDMVVTLLRRVVDLIPTVLTRDTETESTPQTLTLVTVMLAVSGLLVALSVLA